MFNHIIRQDSGSWFAFKFEVKTKDNVFTKLALAVQYKVEEKNAAKAFFSLDDPIKQMDSYIENVVRLKEAARNEADAHYIKEIISLVMNTQHLDTLETIGKSNNTKTLFLETQVDFYIKTIPNLSSQRKLNLTLT